MYTLSKHLPTPKARTTNKKKQVSNFFLRPVKQDDHKQNKQTK